jgi:hypothetical protein
VGKNFTIRVALDRGSHSIPSDLASHFKDSPIVYDKQTECHYLYRESNKNDVRMLKDQGHDLEWVSIHQLNGQTGLTTEQIQLVLRCAAR